jgi:large subunit ribosomal protein L21
MSYAIISLGGKQYRVREGQRLLVDRLALEDGATFSPQVLLVGGDGAPALSPGEVVTAKVLGEAKGPKIRIGKYKKRTGYKRHTGFRASLTQIQIESIGAATTRSSAKKAAPAPTSEPVAQETASEEALAAPAGLPDGYADMKIADLKAAVGGWDAEAVAAALAYEQAHDNRKGAIAALEAALTEKEA